MPFTTKYVLIVSMDVDADKEALFNDIYDKEHIPYLMKVPGVRSVTRIKGEAFAFSMAGATKQVEHTGPRYSAIYEIDSPAVVSSAEWGKAVELGRWAGEVRPFTRNRHSALYKVR